MHSRVPMFRGYEYQDLITAILAVDVMLGEAVRIRVDQGFHDDDRFDDITLNRSDGMLQRIQVKHRSDGTTPFPLADFISDSRRKLSVDKLIQSAIRTRSLKQVAASDFEFRILLFDSPPVDERLLHCLVPINKSTESIIPSASTQRFHLKFDALVEQHANTSGVSRGNRRTIAQIVSNSGFKEEDVRWVCERLILEFGCPGMSGDLGSPGAVESILLDRIQSELGAGIFPNIDRAPHDVAGGLTQAATSARAYHYELTVDKLLELTQLRSDYGAVAESKVINPSIEVVRTEVLEELSALVEECARRQRPIIVQAEPGQGKSWTSERLVDQLRKGGWHVAFHVCYVSSDDVSLVPRVTPENVVGTLQASFEDLMESSEDVRRPIYAASLARLNSSIAQARDQFPDKKFALIVDGIDHVRRVRDRQGLEPKYNELGSQLALIELPEECTLVVLSQPTDELDPLVDSDAEVWDLPRFSFDETEKLVQSHGLIDENPLPYGMQPIAEAIDSRARGNALYTQYLCVELARSDLDPHDRSTLLSLVPTYDGSLTEYYDYLCTKTESARNVAQILSVLEFGITQDELKHVVPAVQDSIEPALQVLRPVLREDPSTRTIRYHHESFARSLMELMSSDQFEAINHGIARWLSEQGFLEDDRANRYLIPSLVSAGDFEPIRTLITPSFVSEGITYGIPPEAMLRNLSHATQYAARRLDWPFVVRCMHLSYAAKSYLHDILGREMVDFADVAVAVIGAPLFTARMQFEGRISFPARDGLLLCAALDSLGERPPWELYLEAYEREKKHDNTTYADGSNKYVSLAINRGLFRLHLAGSTPEQFSKKRLELVRYLEESDYPHQEMAEVLLDTIGWDLVQTLLPEISTRREFGFRVLHEAFLRGHIDKSQFLEQITGVSLDELSVRDTSQALELGLKYQRLWAGSVDELVEATLNLTSEIQAENPDIATTERWLKHLRILADAGPHRLSEVEGRICGAFWYRNWLRFCVQLAQIERQSTQTRSESAANAISLLTKRLAPFEGKPRTVDLYSLKPFIRERIDTAIGMLDDEGWPIAARQIITMIDGLAAWLKSDVSGPYEIDSFIESLIETGSTPERSDLAIDFISDLEQRFIAQSTYAFLSRFAFYRSRLFLDSGEVESMKSEWFKGCALLAGYGHHKEISIFDLLDPMKALIRSDVEEGRERLKECHPLMRRVASHTDGDEVSHAEKYWLDALALADPLDASHRVVRWSTENRGFEVEYSALTRSYIWENHLDSIDVGVSGLVRYSLKSPTHKRDAEFLSRLADLNEDRKWLLTALSSRYDECPTDPSDSVSSKTSLAFKKAVAMFRRLEVPVSEIQGDSRVAEEPTGAHSSQVQEAVDQEQVVILPGIHGILQIARAVRRIDQGRRQDAAATAASIADRLMDLINTDRGAETELAIRTIAEVEEYYRQSPILDQIVGMLEQAHHPAYAAALLANRWTRCHGGGGYLRFGGKTALGALRRAMELDAHIALSELEKAIGQVIFEYSPGVSQALMFGLLEGALPTEPQTSGSDVAFQCWDEVCAVLAMRLPRLSLADDREHPYSPDDGNGGPVSQTDIEASMIEATISAVVHPLREQKRRALIALRELLEIRPTETAEVLARLLPRFADPLDLTSVLMCISASSTAKTVANETHDQLRDLVESRYLSVTIAAHDLISKTGTTIPFGHVSMPRVEMERSVLGVSPLVHSMEQRRVSQELDEINAIIGSRLDEVDSRYPFIVPDILDSISLRFTEPTFKERIREQLEFARPFVDLNFEIRIASDEVAEEELQTACASVKSKAWSMGEGVVSDEALAEFGRSIYLDPNLPLAIERMRRPRPNLPRMGNPKSAFWTFLDERAESGQQSLQRLIPSPMHQMTIGIEDLGTDQCITLEGSDYRNWRLIGFAEHQKYITDSLRGRGFEISQYAGVQLHNLRSDLSKTPPPVLFDESSSLTDWKRKMESVARFKLSNSMETFVNVDHRLLDYGDHRRGLGLPASMVSPSPWLQQRFHLDPCTDFVMADSEGAAVALLAWRSDYHQPYDGPPFAKCSGTGLILRPDLFDQIVSQSNATSTFRRVLIIPNSAMSSLL